MAHWRFYTVSYKLKDGKTDSSTWPKLVSNESDPCSLTVEDVYAFYKNFGSYIHSMLVEVKIYETFTVEQNVTF